MKKMLHIYANQYPPLSDAYAMKDKWRELAKAFDEYHVLARSFDNKYHHYIEENLHYHALPAMGRKCRSIYISALFIFFLIPRYKITSLLINSAILGGLYGIWASKIFRIPAMVEIHGDEYFAYLSSPKIIYAPIRKMIRYVFRKADKIRSLNRMMTEKLIHFGYTNNVVEIPNRVDLKIFQPPKMDEDFNFPVKIISIGNFVEPKNHLGLIQNLTDAKINYHLKLVGGGLLQNEYKELTKKLGVEENVELIKKLEQRNLVEQMLDSDIYVQYSSREGMPRAILEAMALKLPVISSNVGSINGIIRHKENGLLVALNDPMALANAILLLKNDPTLRKKMIKNAYLEVLTHYEWNKSFEHYRQVLMNLQEKK